MSSNAAPARIAIVMGSKSDWSTMQFTAEILTSLDVPFHVEVVSAHRTPDKLFSFAETAADQGFRSLLLARVARHICRVCWRLKPCCRYWACRYRAPR